jgi:transposase-like protein
MFLMKVDIKETHFMSRIRWFQKVDNILVRKHEGKRSLGRHRCKLKDNIRMYLREVEWEGVNRMHLAQDRDQWEGLVNTSVNLQVP